MGDRYPLQEDLPRVREVTEAHFVARVARVVSTCAKPGWDGRRAAAVDPARAEQSVSLARALVERGLPWPYTYPNDDGGLSLEWTVGQWDISLDMGPTSVEGDATNVKTGDSHDFELAADAPQNDVVQATMTMFEAAGWPQWGDR